VLLMLLQSLGVCGLKALIRPVRQAGLPRISFTFLNCPVLK